MTLGALSRVLRHPTASAFEAERPNARLNEAILLAFGIGAVAGMVGGCLNWLFAGSSAADIIVLTIITPLRLIVALLISQAFLYLVARLLGGRGGFAEQTFLGALVFVPLNAIAALLAVFPGIGPFLATAILAINIVLMVPALRAAHGIQTWHVSIIILLPATLVAGILAWFTISSLAL